MKTKINLIMINCFLFVIMPAFAQRQVSIDEATNAAIRSLNRNNYNAKPVLTKSTVSKINSVKNEKNDTLLYEVVFADGQGVLLSGHKSCLPVLGYYDASNGISVFDEDAPAGLKALLYGYEQQIRASFEQKTTYSMYATEWSKLQNNDTIDSNYLDSKSTRALTATIKVAPLIKTAWAQRYSADGVCDAYNHYVTEIDSDCNNSTCTSKKCPAGCGAVAMAQIMNYWKYPVYDASYGAEQYDWCNMPDRLRSYSSKYEKERHAIARLIKDCGVASNTRYCFVGGCQSMSFIDNIRDALVNKFNYSPDADQQRQIWHLRTWKDKLKKDLDKGMPVLYSALDGIGNGHIFICDGYRDDDYFHFNWGWGPDWQNNEETWFTIGNISPGNYEYNTLDQAIFNIYPKMPLVTYCNNAIHLLQHYVWTQGNTNLQPHANVPKTATWLYSADAQTTAAVGGNSSWYTIPSGASSEYVAHEVIVLRPGFHAQSGSNFKARIEPCGSCGSQIQVASYSMIEEERSLQQNLNTEAEFVYDDNVETSDVKINNIEIAVYPNPNNGSFIVELISQPTECFEIQIINQVGITLLKKCIDNKEEIIIPNAQPGIYFVIVESDNKISTQKMIVQ